MTNELERPKKNVLQGEIGVCNGIDFYENKLIPFDKKNKPKIQQQNKSSRPYLRRKKSRKK